MSLVPVYQRRPSALHAARAGVAASFCIALAFAAILFDNPIVLGSLLCAIFAAAIGAGVIAAERGAGRPSRRAWRCSW